MQKTETLLFCTLVIGGSACGSGSSSSLKEKINPINDPNRLQYSVDWETNVEALPIKGESKTLVWSGNWWPLSKGGTIIAMKKYDQATGARAAVWEQATVTQFGGVHWAGHCNGLAAAGIREKRPRRSVEYNGVTFTRQDVEALLVEKWQESSRVPLIGGRCNSSLLIDATGRVVNEECRDFNAGSFHIVLGNMLGKEKTSFIMDIDTETEVWNYPVVWYQSDVTSIDREEAIRLTGQAGSYRFNPEAVQFRRAFTHVILSMGYSKIYRYVLELNAEGDIIGGEWTGSSRHDHPDFAWYMQEPQASNPELDLKVIDEIAAQSFN